MQLVTKLLVGATGAFVITGALIGITIPLATKNNSNSTGQEKIEPDVCDETNHCEHPQECVVVDGSRQCKCPHNELLIQALTYGTHERRCRKSCNTGDDCETGTLCFEGSFFAPPYCEDRNRVAECSDAVKCTSDTECRLTNDMMIECLCKNELEATRIESTESGSTRTCSPSCENSNGCPRTKLCLKDKYSKQGYCKVGRNECPGEVQCPDSTACKLNTDGLALCYCESGYTEIEDAGLNTTTITCHAQTCGNSNGCGRGELCYQDETSLEFYCADAAKGCDRAVCPDRTECLDTTHGYSECLCSKGYTSIGTVTAYTTIRICTERTCSTSNDCEEEYLCYFDNHADRFGICSIRLKGCDGVECPPNTAGCRLTLSNIAECLCNEREYTAVDRAVIGGTIRTCHTLTCTTSNDCDGTSLCFKDSISEDLYCDDSATKCTSEVVCPEDSHCSDSRGEPQCFCDADETTTPMRKGRDANGIITATGCFRQCADSSNCFPGSICYIDDSFVGNGCHEDRTPDAQRHKCSKVLCSPETECSDDNVVADCLCKDNALTLIRRTTTGSERICGNVKCRDERDCRRQGARSVCFSDPYSFQNQCVEPKDVTSCDHVRCSWNFVCLPFSNWKCGCLSNERLAFGDTCYKRCSNDAQCENDRLGTCQSDNRCEYATNRS